MPSLTAAPTWKRGVFIASAATTICTIEDKAIVTMALKQSPI